jgi:hypothetical protein
LVDVGDDGDVSNVGATHGGEGHGMGGSQRGGESPSV